MQKLLALILLCSSLQAGPQTFLVFGGSQGWIGQKLIALFRAGGHTAIAAKSRLENREAIIAEINLIKPDALINAAGITGRPDNDWCETHRQETLRTNVIGTLNLADIAYQHNLHLTNMSTGGIYIYDEQHPMWSGIGFTEEDAPNFDDSFYSSTKIMMEKMILNYPNVLNLRVQFPISTDLQNGFVARLIKAENVMNIPNSLCVLDDLLPLAVDMTLRRITGLYNFVNPGVLSQNQVLELYKEYVDPALTWQNFTQNELDLMPIRANAELSAAKLLQLYPDLPHIKEALISLFKKIGASYEKNKSGSFSATSNVRQ
jgi:dTDP-4-dehydrorhamnose reductase